MNRYCDGGLEEIPEQALGPLNPERRLQEGETFNRLLLSVDKDKDSSKMDEGCLRRRGRRRQEPFSCLLLSLLLAVEGC